MSTKTQIILTHPSGETSGTLAALLQKNVSGRQEALLLARYFEQLANGGRQASFTVASGALAKASATVTFTDTGEASDTIIVNGTTFSAAASGATGNQYNVGVKATATLTATAPITLTKSKPGSVHNTKTFTLNVNAAAANPTDTVLVAFTGTASAIICTVTPNDGTNNTATPVTVTTANLVQLINTGLITAKTPTITDSSSLRTLQTATGGGVTALAHSGEGDGVVGIYAGGTGTATLTAASLAAAIVGSATTAVNTTVTASSALGVCTVTAKDYGYDGNAITLAEGVDADSVISVNAAKLSGGGEPTSTPYHCGF